MKILWWGRKNMVFGICLLGFFFIIFFMALLFKSTTNVAIPKIKIELDGVTLDEINGGSKMIEYEGNKMVLVDDGYEYVFDDVEIRGRGNASWLMDKKSYRIKMPQRVDLLGLGKMQKWGLISNNIDDTLMRNDLGHYIASFLYDDYPIHGEFVDLEIDDKDLGLYYVTKLVDIDKRSIDLRDKDGILVEIDNAYCDDIYALTETMLDCVSEKDVVVKDKVEEIFLDFLVDYNRFEVAVKRGNFSEAAKIVDMESWGKYYLLNEFSSNPDAYVTSWYLYKDGNKDRIHANIGWDFDASFGNRNWGKWADDFYSPMETLTRIKYSIDEWSDYDENGVERCKLLGEDQLVSPTMCYMLGMAEFRELVARIYRERLMGRREEMLSYIYKRAAYIREAAILDNKMWGKGDFDEAVEYLVWWVDKRFDLFDDLYGRIELVPEES